MPDELSCIMMSVNGAPQLAVTRSPKDISSLVLSGSNHIALENPLDVPMEIHLKIEIKALCNIEQALRRVPWDPYAALDFTNFAVTGTSSATPDEQGEDLELVKIKPCNTCPITLQRIRIPGKGISCRHGAVFDVRSYLLLGSKTDTWKCPICALEVYPEDLIRM